MAEDWLEQIKWDDQGLVPAVAQDSATGQVLMLAWMDRCALRETSISGHAVYWSRSRRALWRKGEISGHVQIVSSIRLDCDNDVILLGVEQVGGIACHTGRAGCFFKTLQNGQWLVSDPVLKSPDLIYPNAPALTSNKI